MHCEEMLPTMQSLGTANKYKLEVGRREGETTQQKWRTFKTQLGAVAHHYIASYLVQT